MKVHSVWLDENLEKQLEFLMKKRKIRDKSSYIRQLIDKSLKEELIDYLCQEVKEKRMSSWKAADITQISLRSFLSELHKRNIETYDELARKKDLEFALEE